MKSYEHLEGKILDYKRDGELVPFKVEVIGCDRDVGLSVVVAKDFDGDDVYIPFKKGEEMMCLHGKSSPHREEYEEQNPLYAESYDNTFDIYIKEIENGCITSDVDMLLGVKKEESDRIEASFMQTLFGNSVGMECAFK